MSKARLKLVIWLLLGLFFISIALGVVSATARLLAFFQRGADPATALNIVPNVIPDIGVDLTWAPPPADPGRVPDLYMRDQIGQAYLRGWLEWNLAHARGDGRGLATAFTGPALLATRSAVATASQQGLKITQVDIAHRLQITFLSADATVATLVDSGSGEVRLIRDRAGTLLYSGEVHARYTVVLVFEDGRWRIRQMTRTVLEPYTPAGDAFAAVRTSLPGIVQVKGTQLLRDGQPLRVAGINYYPQATPWDQFWLTYTPAIIDRDFGRMRSLGLNTVRIFVPYTQFGGDRVRPDLLRKLVDYLDRADANGMLVVVTLFDFRTDYNPLLWPLADRQLETILTQLKEHRALLAWDLKNEPDLDYKQAGRETVDLWLAHTLRMARIFDPHHLVTIGWSSAQAAATFPGVVDLASFHDYLPPSGLLARYQVLREALPDRPILLGEYGLPTWNSPFFPNGHSELEQARYYADVQGVLRSTDSVGSMAWTLYDFSRVPSSVAGGMPWQSGPQSALGVLHADGLPKPAAAMLAPDTNLDVPQFPFYLRLLKPFWAFWTGVVVASLLWVRRRRLRRAAHLPPRQ